MPYEALAVANEFVALALAEAVDLTPMKLQKLVYYAHGWCLGLRGEPLLDEQIEAWEWGPVVESLYFAFANYGNQPILQLGQETSFDSEAASESHHRFGLRTPRLIDSDLDSVEFARSLIRKVWESHKHLSAIQLSKMTHAPRSPWDRVRQKYRTAIPKGTDIPEDWIREEFESRVRQPETAH